MTDIQRPFYQVLQQYFLRFEDYTAATIVNEHRAASYAHGLHSHLRINDKVCLWTVPGNRPIDFTVTNINTKSDFVILETTESLPHLPIVLPSPGSSYHLLGFSNRQATDPFSISNGIITTAMVDVNNHIRGTSGAAERDSGGPCIGEGNVLYGMVVGAEAIAVSPETTLQQLATQYTTKAVMVPANALSL